MSTAQADITDIKAVIPSNASSSNKLVTVADVPAGGTSDYTDLTNKPTINNVTLAGNKTTSDLSLASASDMSTAQADITDIKAVIPSNASSSNKLVTVADLPSNSSLPEVVIDLSSKAGVVDVKNNIVPLLGVYRWCPMRLTTGSRLPSTTSNNTFDMNTGRYNLMYNSSDNALYIKSIFGYNTSLSSQPAYNAPLDTSNNYVLCILLTEVTVSGSTAQQGTGYPYVNRHITVSGSDIILTDGTMGNIKT